MGRFLVPESMLPGVADLDGVTAYDDSPGSGPADLRSLDEVELYVPAYMGPPWTLEAMRQMPRLRACQLLTAGFEHAVPLVPPGVTLCNAGRLHDTSTAELAMALILARLRNLDGFARAMPEGRWEPGRFDSLADRRVLVVGYGGIGAAVAARARAFEADVVGVARAARTDDDVAVHAMADLPRLLPDADVVVVCVPLDDTTRGLVDAGFLARMRDGALLVNVARGAVADTDAIVREAGRLRFALDVADPEPLPPDHPLWLAPGVLISPHVGGNSSAFLPRARALVGAQIGRWARGEPLHHVVRG